MFAILHSRHPNSRTSGRDGKGKQMNAKQLIAQAEQAAKAHQRRTGCNDTERGEYEVCKLQGLLADACEKLAAVTNPADCIEDESDFVQYGMRWIAGDDVWAVYLGGQDVTPFTRGQFYTDLCAAAEKLRLGGLAA